MNNPDYNKVLTAIAKALLGFLVALAICATLPSCKRVQYIEKPVVLERKTTDTLLINTFRIDSIYVHDSVYVNTYQRGDTIYRDTHHYHIYKENGDGGASAYKVRVDSVPYPVEVPVIKEVEKPLTKWEQFEMNMGGILIGMGVAVLLMAGFAVWRIVKK